MIIGFIGFQRVGKTTASNYLINKYGFVRHNMKDALVAEIKQNFPDLLVEIGNVTQEYIEPEKRVDVTDLLFQLKPPLMRALLQNYGTEVRRRDRPDYWTRRWEEGVRSEKMTIADDTIVVGYAVPKDIKVVTDDVRFKNEARVVKENGGILIRLTRPDITTGGSHASETEQLEIEADYTIECVPGDHEHLYRELDRIIGMVK